MAQSAEHRANNARVVSSSLTVTIFWMPLIRLFFFLRTKPPTTLTTCFGLQSTRVIKARSAAIHCHIKNDESPCNLYSIYGHYIGSDHPLISATAISLSYRITSLDGRRDYRITFGGIATLFYIAFIVLYTS